MKGKSGYNLVDSILVEHEFFAGAEMEQHSIPVMPLQFATSIKTLRFGISEAASGEMVKICLVPNISRTMERL